MEDAEPIYTLRWTVNNETQIKYFDNVESVTKIRQRNCVEFIDERGVRRY